MKKLQQIFAPSLIAGGIGVVIAKYVYDIDISQTEKMIGIDLPGWLVVGSTVFTGSVLGEFTSDVVIPKIPRIQALGNLQHMILPPTITGITTYGAMFALVSPETSFSSAFVIGVTSSVGGKYTANYFNL
jgi:hypothetical protein